MDGFLYIIRIKNGATKEAASDIFVDINAGAGPNKFGRDMFTLVRVPDGKGVQPLGYDLDDESVKESCSQKTHSDQITCAERIKRAGWKIDNSYPWK